MRPHHRLSIAMLLLLLAGCASEPAAPSNTPVVASVTLSSSEHVVLGVGESLTLSATAKDAAGTAISGAVIGWTSSVPSVATVSAQGMVTAMSAGTTTIGATNAGKSASVEVQVSDVAQIEITPRGVLLGLGEQLQLQATPRDAAGSAVDAPVTWTSLTPGVLGISPQGLLSVVAAGNGQVQASAGGRTSSVVYTVLNGPVLSPASTLTTYTAGPVIVTIPSGRFTSTGTLNVVTIDPPLADPRLIGGKAYEIRPTGMALTGPVEVSIGYTAVPAGLLAPRFRLHRWTGTTWQEVLFSTVNTSTNVRRVSGSVSQLGIFAIIEVQRVLASIDITPVPGAVAVGSTLFLTGMPKDSGGGLLTDIGGTLSPIPTITWTSDQPALATVATTGGGSTLQRGVVTGVVPGTTTIRAASGTITRATPVTVTARSFDLLQLSGGAEHSCGLDGAGAAWCWGKHTTCRLGTTPQTIDFFGFETCISGNGNLPARVLGPTVYTRIAAGGTHTCGLAVDGTPWCWGDNNLLQAGKPASTARVFLPAAVAVPTPLASLAAGWDFTCGLTAAGAALCWGNNAAGALGDGTQISRFTPAVVGGGQSFNQLRAGREFACGLTAAGAAWCWGNNAANQTGTLGIGAVLLPTAVNGGHVFTAIAAGGFHACGLKADGSVWCWGRNEVGQVGNGTASTANVAAPVKVTGSHLFTALAAGPLHSCGIDTAGAIWCWGNGVAFNSFGSQTNPTLLGGGHLFSSLASIHADHGCGRVTGGGIWCWGTNSNGTHGDGSTASSPLPQGLLWPGGLPN